MGFQFLFTAALWALPLAGLPLVLHLLFRQKAPVIPFSTLRFIQSSMQQTAARRRIQRWLLLACRALLVALLIWALAQPVRKLSANLLGGGGSTAAAIVVDTSYSMMLQDQQRSLLQQADDDIQDLLRTELRDARVAIYRGSSTAPHLQPADTYRGDRWEALVPTPSPAPLIDSIDAAADMLTASGEDNKWLIVLTDSQTREFPRPPPKLGSARTIFIDLHPADSRSAAITDVRTDPAQPRLGIPAQIAVTLSGRPNDAQQVQLQIAPAGQAATTTSPLPLARFDATGRAELRWPFSFVDSSWLLVTAQLTSTESLPWAASRDALVRIPARQSAAVLAVGHPNPTAVQMIQLALDPSQGERPAWPLVVHDGEVRWDESLVVAILNQWPDALTLQRMTDFAQRGGSLVLFVQPGLEQDWPTLDAPRQQALTALLPSAPQPAPPDATYHASIARPNDPILAGTGDTQLAGDRLVVTRLMRFSPNSQTQAIVNAAPTDPDSGAELTGLLWHKKVGAGSVYTWATLPDRSCGNLRVWDLFPPMLVNSAATPGAMGEEATVNVDIGQPISLPAAIVPADAEVDLIPPPPNQRPVKVDRSGDRYTYSDTSQPGLYAWRWRRQDAQGGLLGWSNLQIPSAEARLTYRPLSEIAPDQANTIAAHSLEEVRQRLVQLAQPHPQWTLPIALVLALLCLEALLGAMPKRGGGKGPDSAHGHAAPRPASHLAASDSR